MRRVFVGFLFLSLAALAACGDSPQPAAPDTLADVPPLVDGMDDDVDATTTDVAAVDTFADATADVQVCPDLGECELSCVFGRMTDTSGCETCACRDCNIGSDCALSGCETEVCSAVGACSCDCTDVADRTYACPDGEVVPFCTCNDEGVTCNPNPELQCGSLCAIGMTDTMPCPDATTIPWCECQVDDCVPVCRNAVEGREGQGWYDPCEGTLLLAAACGDGCLPVCEAIGSRSEGWYDSCGGERIRWAFCGPHRVCDSEPLEGCASLLCEPEQTAEWQCQQGGEDVEFCGCTPPAADCVPVCVAEGTPQEGWQNPCTGDMLKTEKCANCDVTCNAIGSRSEGWYSSCSGLLAYAFCGTGFWQCRSNPWNWCEGPAR